MISRIRDRLGPAGFVLAIVALVAALAGGAYAASGGLSGKQKKEVEKIAKKFAGKPGAPGATGPQGPAGPAGKDGSNGAKGDTGDKGEKGEKGDTGNSGTSVTTQSFTGTKQVGSVECTEGGVEVKSASPATAVCNGKGGSGGGPLVLEESQTETGTWNFVSNGATEQVVPISFPIPLAAGDVEAMTVEFLNENQETSTECPGTVEEPKAEPGVLCIYTTPLLTTSALGGTAYKPVSKKKFEELPEPYVRGVVSSGTYLVFENISNGQTAGGTFAVTAPEAP